MTLQTTSRVKTHTGNSVATVFPYDFLIPTAADLEVYVYDITDATLTLISPSLYSVSGLGSALFGNVTYPLTGSPLTSDEQLRIVREVPLTQLTDLSNQGAFYLQSVEDRLDRITMQIQQLAEEQGRMPRAIVGEVFNNDLPAKSALANKYLAFDASGEPQALSTVVAGVLALPVSVANGGTGSPNAPGAIANLGAAPAADLDVAEAALALLQAVYGAARVRVATTAAITISTALNNADTIDGIVLATGDLVLVKNQAAPAENGVYVVGAVPARSLLFAAYNDHAGRMFRIEEGTANANTSYICTSAKGGTIGVTALAFSQGVGTLAALITLLTAAATDMEAGTSTVLFVTPGQQHRHPSAAKCWAYVTGGGTPTLAASFNITSITDSGVGDLLITIATDFSSANWSPQVSATQPQSAFDNMQTCGFGTMAAGTIQLRNNLLDISAAAETPVDPDAWSFVGFGDQ